jgi:cell wall assembly regulator SMI1
MSRRTPRVFGTTEEAIRKAETALGRTLPPSFRDWLIANNAGKLGDANINVYPVMDERDPRMTWDSIDRKYKESWASWLENFEDEDRDFDHLLPFADPDGADFYCFDYTRRDAQGEAPVVLWSHETGDTEDRAESFPAFVAKIKAGEFEDD